MTEEDWLVGVHPADMLGVLRRRASGRKLRLFGCACCRYSEVWRLLGYGYGWGRGLVETVERFVEDESDWEQVEKSLRSFPGARATGHKSNPFRINRTLQAQRMVLQLASADAWNGAERIIGEGVALLDRIRCELLQDLFGNPFRPSPPLPHAVLTWNDRIIPRIAQGIYDERQLPSGTLDTSRLAILHDALLDAGCDNKMGNVRCSTWRKLFLPVFLTQDELSLRPLTGHRIGLAHLLRGYLEPGKEFA